MSDMTKPQPAPKPGARRVLDLVVADLQARAEDGRLKYGTYLETWNGRNPLVDAYQEALDQCMYLRQAIEEYGELARAQLRNLMSDLSEELWCAGWLSGLEHALWGRITDGPPTGLRDSEVDQLRRLASLAGGWWHWPREDGRPVKAGPVFVPMDEWLMLYARREKERG